MTVNARLRLPARTLLFCFCLVTAGCGSGPRINRLTADSVILAFGDSLTAGTGAEEGQGYPAVLAQLTGCRVVASGVPGEETPAARLRLPDVLQKEKPALVVLCIGGNDLLRKQPDAVIRENIDAMITTIREAGADVVLIGVPRPGLWLTAAPLYRDLGRQHGIPCETEALADILSDKDLKSDPIHPNAEGYRKLAEAVAALLRASAVR